MYEAPIFPSPLIHPASWKWNSANFGCDILNEMERRDFLELPEAPGGTEPIPHHLEGMHKNAAG
jgi:hypothetical protein